MSQEVTHAPPPSAFSTWFHAIRPKTLPAAVAPVVVGTALAYADGVGRALPALAALVGALLIQIGTNLINDYYDFKKGADTPDRVGPMRITQAGLASPKVVLWAGVGTFAAAFVIGIYLVVIAGWWLVAIGLASLLAGYAYTGGPFPLAYLGLGDLFVMIFFGFAAVGGTYFVQAGTVAPGVWYLAAAMGALSTAILVTNNLRDVTTDTKAGKRTLIVRFGTGAGKAEYLGMLAIAAIAPVLMVVQGHAPGTTLLALVAFVLAVPPVRRVLRESGKALNPALGETARVMLLYSVLFAVGVLAG